MPGQIDEAAHASIERACERLVNQFAYLNDDDQPSELASLFTDDGRFARPMDPTNPVIGRDKIEAFFRDRPKRLNRHFISNILIDAQSATEAVGRCYLVYYSNGDADAKQPAPAEPSVFGGYRDRFVKVDGKWLFAERIGSASLVIGAQS